MATVGTGQRRIHRTLTLREVDNLPWRVREICRAILNLGGEIEVGSDPGLDVRAVDTSEDWSFNIPASTLHDILFSDSATAQSWLALAASASRLELRRLPKTHRNVRQVRGVPKPTVRSGDGMSPTRIHGDLSDLGPISDVGSFEVAWIRGEDNRPTIIRIPT